MKKKIGSLALAVLLFPLVAAAETVEIKPDHPDRYVVQRGDTLWDISSQFLNEPWLWPEIWEVNPQIENPHLIFPGDEVFLRWVDGKPVISVQRGAPKPAGEDDGSGVVRRRLPGGTIKLSPRVRVSEIEEAIPTIPIDIIQQFLKRPRLVTERQIDASPYVVSVGREALIGKPGKKIYARGIDGEAVPRYAVYRKGQRYEDPDRNNELLGYEAIHIADAVLDRSGDPATLTVTSAQRELLGGDRLLPLEEEEVHTSFMPRAPEREVEGQIISVVDGVSQIGQYQVVVLNLGREAGMEAGHVMAVLQRGDVIEDPYLKPTQKAKRGKGAQIELDPAKQGGLVGVLEAFDAIVVDITDLVMAPFKIVGKEEVKLPDERAGIIMVFRTFERLSYALVMEATRPIHVHDMVRNP